MPPSEPEAVYSINEGTEKVLLGGITTPSGPPYTGGELVSEEIPYTGNEFASEEISYTGGKLIITRFSHLCKEVLGVVVQENRTFPAPS